MSKTNKPTSTIQPDGASRLRARFYQALGAKDDIEGWSYNPWGAADTADARLTEIANTYIERITKRLNDKGFFPLMGVEVNAIPFCDVDIKSDADKDSVADYVVEKIYQANEIYYPHYIQQHYGLSPYQQKLKSTAILKKDAQPKGPVTIAVVSLQESVAAIQDGVFINEAHYGELSALVYQLIADKVIAPDFLTAWNDYSILREKAQAEAYDKNIGVPNVIKDSYDCDETLGRVYKDVEEIEVCTPPQSPADTVRSVNAIKRTLFEATYNYEAEYAKAARLDPKSDEWQEALDQAPRSTYAALLRHVLKTPLNITFNHNQSTETKLTTSGEHLSVSVLQQTGEGVVSYESLSELKKCDEGVLVSPFASANLLNNNAFDECLAYVMENVMGSDYLLAIGNDDYVNKTIVGKEHLDHHYIRSNANPPTDPNDKERKLAAADARLEARSFNNAASNIALSVLAMLCAVDMTIRILEAEPKLHKVVFENGRQLTDKQQTLLYKRMHEISSPSYDLRDRHEDVRKDFVEQSATIGMMRKWAQENASNEEELRAYENEIDAFDELAEDRFNMAIGHEPWDRAKAMQAQVEGVLMEKGLGIRG